MSATTVGSFIFAEIENSERKCFIISKLDFKRFFEKKTYELSSGLPEDEGILKSCLINLNDDSSQEEIIYLMDKNGKVAQFWHSNFLSAKQERSDETNTSFAYDDICRVIRRKVIKISKPDYFQLKENVNAYFSSNNSFDYDEFVECVFNDYTPISDDVKIDNLILDVKKEKEKGRFDGNFNIEVSVIRNKLKNVIKLDEGIELRLNGTVSDRIFKTTYNNESYLMIKTKDGTDSFINKEL